MEIQDFRMVDCLGLIQSYSRVDTEFRLWPTCQSGHQGLQSHYNVNMNNVKHIHVIYCIQMQNALWLCRMNVFIVFVYKPDLVD